MMFNLIIPTSIKEKLTPSSTNTLVHVLYLQWAYMLTQMIILNMSKELVGDWGSLLLPVLVGCMPSIFLYRMIRNWRKTVSEDVTEDKNPEDKNNEELSTISNKAETSSSDESLPGMTKLRKPSISYFLWFNEVGRELVMEENPDMELKEVAKKAGKVWQGKGKEEKKMWKKKLMECKEKYEKEMKNMGEKE